MLRRVEISRLFSAARTVLAKEGEVGAWRGKSNAAVSVSSVVPSSWVGRKRVSKEKRRALVESYVNEYRKSNDGKFPSVTDTRKHAGGSYYAVRKMVQELECASKSHPSTVRTVISVEGDHTDEKKVSKFRLRVTAVADSECSSQNVAGEHVKRVKEDVEVTSISSGKLGDHKDEADDFNGSDFNKLHTKKVEQHEICTDVDAKDDLRMQTDKQGVVGRMDGFLKHTRKEDFTGSPTSEGKEHPSRSHSDPEESATRKDDAEHSGATSFWEDVKTFADALISIWRGK